MKPKIFFTKLVGTGNDFILIDNRQKRIRSHKVVAQRLTHRQNGIGADGVLFLERARSRKANLRMRIFNPDGSEAEMCGNGIRCLVYYAYHHGLVPKRMQIETIAGVLAAEITEKGQIRVQLSSPKDWKLDLSFQRDGVMLQGGFVNTGVPHAVFLVDDLEKVDVGELGRWIRYHSAFAPRGTNVNFVQCKGTHQIAVRTYERGVEAETLACGTGVTASALIAAQRKKISPPVQVLTKGGETLTVDFKQESDTTQQVWLEGSVRMIFKGEIFHV